MNYQKIYQSIIDYRKKNILIKTNNGTIETHHIIPKACGGTNQKTNLVNLTLREHYIVHVLLLKIHMSDEFKVQMAHAWQKMCGKLKRSSNLTYAKINSRLFETIRCQANIAMSGLIWVNNGKQNLRVDPNFIPAGFNKGIIPHGKIWINNGIKEMYEFEDNIPVGYVKGRLPKIINGLNKQSCLGTKFINNGILTKRIPKDQPIPPGYVLGRLMTDKMKQHNKCCARKKCSDKCITMLRNLIWISNGSNAIRINKLDEIPVGWHRGRK